MVVNMINGYLLWFDGLFVVMMSVVIKLTVVGHRYERMANLIPSTMGILEAQLLWG